MQCVVKGGIGKHSLRLREEADMTQEAVANKVGCSFATISRWEAAPEATIRTQIAYVKKFNELYRSRMRRAAKLEVLKVSGRRLLELV